MPGKSPYGEDHKMRVRFQCGACTRVLSSTATVTASTDRARCHWPLGPCQRNRSSCVVTGTSCAARSEGLGKATVGAVVALLGARSAAVIRVVGTPAVAVVQVRGVSLLCWSAPAFALQPQSCRHMSRKEPVSAGAVLEVNVPDGSVLEQDFRSAAGCWCNPSPQKVRVMCLLSEQVLGLRGCGTGTTSPGGSRGGVVGDAAGRARSRCNSSNRWGLAKSPRFTAGQVGPGFLLTWGLRQSPQPLLRWRRPLRRCETLREGRGERRERWELGDWRQPENSGELTLIASSSSGLSWDN